MSRFFPPFLTSIMEATFYETSFRLIGAGVNCVKLLKLIEMRFAGLPCWFQRRPAFRWLRPGASPAFGGATG
ncbi:protein of unknown function [Rhodovastum atsumiense]|nr:protein of unknown function [Rhodovastum atsumiense]